ncbi:hypothetical protein PHYBOEH_002434 [Phytophthora boehmeriae]|uniref:Uncharacterized protein n=1 Tax=Phytophthora boehmeriae TaxID=109152 RepID=A0A8T1XCY3_9STRA|nr:hypothetical protein PHYBOEH_002434 [Phytophthora boehmeriae]
MTGPPSPKRQRTGDKPAEANEPTPEELAQIQKVLESVQKVEEEVEKVNEEQAKEILAIENKYNAKKRPTYVKRNKLLADIPKFWKQTLVNHPLIGNLFDEDDVKALEYLENFDVHFVDENGGYKLEMTFKENPFFSPNTLWKEFKFTDDDELEVKASEISWKDEAGVTEESENFNFFQWFAKTENENEIAEIIKDEVWKNPVAFYTMDEDEDDDEEEEEGEGEENEDEEAEGEDKE